MVGVVVSSLRACDAAMEVDQEPAGASAQSARRAPVSLNNGHTTRFTQDTKGTSVPSILSRYKVQIYVCFIMLGDQRSFQPISYHILVANTVIVIAKILINIFQVIIFGISKTWF